MKIIHASLLALMLPLALAACGEHAQSSDPQVDTTLGQKVREATDKAHKEMAEGNITISKDGGPKIEISPTGDLLINDVAVPLDAKQRALVVQYRGQMMGVVKAGIDVGVQGANLGAQAAGEALKGMFSGDTGKIEARINAEAEKVKQSAAKICDQLPAMLATQQQMAASIPEFKPYVSMTQGDVDECRDGHVNIP